MTAQQSNRRAFERSLWKPPTEGAKKGRQHPSRLAVYERLVQVSIRNNFYNKSELRCPDFTAHTTLATSFLMRSLGLLFKDDGAGFSVLYDTSRTENLLNYLRLQAETPPADGQREGVWTRLSFVLGLKNKYFANFTQIPIATNPATNNFYFTNQNAHEAASGNVILSVGKRVSGDELLPVVSVQHSVPVSKEVEAVRVYAISGVEVLCVPRCVPAAIAAVKDPAKIDCKDIDPADGLELVCTDVIYLDFSLLPEDKYAIEKVKKGQQVDDREEVLYTASYPTPLCFIDLLLTDPNSKPDDESAVGIYPIRNLWPDSETTVHPVDYHLEFARRKTFWTYYVVPQPDTERFEQLEIVDVTPSDPERPPHPIRFAGPCCVRLANGSVAYRFNSTEEIPLEQQSRFRFQLRGYRRGMVPNDGLLVNRMPVASNQQVRPLRRTTALEELKESLCPGAKQDEACKRLIREVRSGPNEQNYSDIYVYV